MACCNCRRQRFVRTGLSIPGTARISNPTSNSRMPGSSAKPKLQRVVSELAAFHGPQQPPAAKSAFELILWEKVAYLANDETRSRAFAALKQRVGTSPTAVASAEASTLREIAAMGGGVAVDQRARRMTEAAELVIG